jgi:hypothetical protein
MYTSHVFSPSSNRYTFFLPQKKKTKESRDPYTNVRTPEEGKNCTEIH